MRPSVAFASLRLLERAGCIVDVPQQQTCCGQPAYNSGEFEAAIPVAKHCIEVFQHAEYVVVPSGSCAGMLTHHFPRLLAGEWRERALELAARTWELTSFLQEVAGPRASASAPKSLPAITYHDSCAGLRELGIKQQPRALLTKLCGARINEMQQTEVCCGFGGTFCAKMPTISAKMADDKLANAQASGAELVVGGDLGCLLHLAGRARREGRQLQFRHIAELLDGEFEAPPIGEPE